jgi:hypothetical protein
MNHGLAIFLLLISCNSRRTRQMGGRQRQVHYSDTPPADAS